jgi:citronellol/citronellal dehydrogenase
MEFALGGQESLKMCRTTDIMADAAHWIFTQDSRACTGNFFIDDTLLYASGVRDFDKYRVDPTQPLAPDFFVPEDAPPPPGVSLAAKS